MFYKNVSDWDSYFIALKKNPMNHQSMWNVYCVYKVRGANYNYLAFYKRFNCLCEQQFIGNGRHSTGP